MDYPEEHPLEGYSGDLESHKDHLEAYSDVLNDASDEQLEAVMLILTGEDGTDTLPSVSEDIDPRWASIWMLGAHIHHVSSAVSQAGKADITMEQVAQDAIQAIRQHQGPQETYGEE